jgi:hypothetical protein
MIKAISLGLCILTIALLSCNNGTAPKESIPAWLDVKIANFKTDPVTNPPRAVIKYKYNNSDVYYVPPVCCDQYGILYSGNGDTLCFPDGGISGQGDGRCSGFFQTASDSALIWKDDRK